MIDGQNIKNMRLDNLRQQISVVSQQAFLFNQSILYNLKYGNPNKTFDEIVEVCKRVNLHDFIMVLFINIVTS